MRGELAEVGGGRLAAPKPISVVNQLIRNQQVVRSIRIAGSKFPWYVIAISASRADIHSVCESATPASRPWSRGYKDRLGSSCLLTIVFVGAYPARAEGPQEQGHGSTSHSSGGGPAIHPRYWAAASSARPTPTCHRKRYPPLGQRASVRRSPRSF